MKTVDRWAMGLGIVVIMDAAVIGAAGAIAADLYSGRQQPAFEPRPLVGYDRGAGQPGIWEGLNLGIDGGYNWSRGRRLDGSGSVDLDGGLAGAHLGYNWQRGMGVLGLETDLAWTNADGEQRYSVTDSLGFRNTWQSSFRLKGGVAVGNLLIYATGGLALGGFDADVATAASSWRAHDNAVGWVAGGGIETKLTQSLGARIEALHYDYGKTSFDTPAGNLKADLSSTTVRAGLTYYFNN